MDASYQKPFHLDVSIIVPVVNEADNIFSLAKEIDDAMGNADFSWECIWVDDGSTDDTLSKIRSLKEADKHHQYISLAENSGQSVAMAKGFKYANGGILVTIDGDGQNDPKDILRLIERLNAENADVVNGVRRMRHDNIIRKLSSRIANGFRNWITRDSITDVGCSLRAIRRECIEHIPLFKGMHRFLPTLIRMTGYRNIIELPVNHRPRKYGQTKYGIGNRLWVGLADTFAVRWMQHRMVFPKTKEKSSLE